MQIPETHYTRSGDVSIAYQVVGGGPFDVVYVPSISHVELAWSRDQHPLQSGQRDEVTHRREREPRERLRRA